MKNGERRLKIGIAQIGIKRRQLRRREQSFIDHSPARQRTEIGSQRGSASASLRKRKSRSSRSEFRSLRSEITLLNDVAGFRKRVGQQLRDWSEPFANPGIAARILLGLRFDDLARCLFLPRRQEDHPEPEHRGQLDAARDAHACGSICPECGSAGRRRHRFFRRRPHLRDAPAGSKPPARDPRSRAKQLRRFGRPGRHRRRRGLWLCDSDSSLHCVSSMKVGSTIENFDGPDGFFGQEKA